MDTGESAAVAADAEMTPEVVPAAKLDRSAQRKKKKAKAVIPSYGEGGLGWGVAPQGEPLAVTVGLVCPSTHIDRVQAYIRDVFDLGVLSVSGDAFSASRLREMEAAARANPNSGPRPPANGQITVRVLLACPISPEVASSVEDSRALAGRLERDPLLCKVLQRAIPLGALRKGEATAAVEGGGERKREREGGGADMAADVMDMDSNAPQKGGSGRECGHGAWSGVSGSAEGAVEALLEFMPRDAIARVTAFPKVAQAALVKGLDARGIPLSPTINNVSISAVVADSGWWHLSWSQVTPNP